MPSLRHDAADLLRTHWDLAVSQVDPIEQGMNSEVVLIHTPAGRYVLKVVPHNSADALRRGAVIADRIDAGVMRTGRPRPTAAGDLTAQTDVGAAALLAEVPGTPFRGDASDEQQAMAHALATVHTSLPTAASDAETFGAWLVPTAQQHPVEPWLSPTVHSVTGRYRTIAPGLTTSWLHTDPAPEAFIHGEPTGLIDWAGAEPGPCLYDLASAVMYLGGPARARPFLAAYAEQSPALAAELADHLEVLLALRYAVQAVYFARRLARADLTGASGQDDNLEGLAFARERLGEAGWIRH